jgi:Ca2+-binding RTX toxin-like protein
VVDASAFTGVTNLTAGGTGRAMLYGGGSVGKGGTLMVTGSGDDVLIGGPGANDLIDNGTGFNILIGGGGPSSITGNGNDILISGKTRYDTSTLANRRALSAIRRAWASNTPYAKRISGIQSGSATDDHPLNATTVKSNGQLNTVSDGTDAMQQNWFIVTRHDAVTARGNETQTIIPSLAHKLSKHRVSMGFRDPGRARGAPVFAAARTEPRPPRITKSHSATETQTIVPS